VRVALLSTMETVAAADGDPRGFLAVAGRSVVQHQMECALALGCEKIACHAHGFPQELVALQHLAERGGASFQVINGPRALSGMVRAADELLVFADGLLPDRVLAGQLLANRPSVLVLPVDEGIAAGFERIDREYAWAGLLMVGGFAVERLADLPADADPVAGLLRIALQAGTRIVSMPPGLLAGRTWGLVQTEGQAEDFEAAWLDRHVQPATFAAPFLAVADRTATAMITRSDRRKAGGLAVQAAAAGLGVLAGLAGWFWEPVAGLALMGAAYFLARTGGALRSIEALGRRMPQGHGRMSGWLGAALDILLAGIATLASLPQDRGSAFLGAAALLLALHLGRSLPLGNWKIVLSDRILLAATLSIAAYFGKLDTGIQTLTVVSLIAILFDSSKSKLTRA